MSDQSGSIWDVAPGGSGSNGAPTSASTGSIWDVPTSGPSNASTAPTGASGGTGTIWDVGPTAAVTNLNPGAPQQHPNLLHQILGGAGKVTTSLADLPLEIAREAPRVATGAGENVINDVTLGHTHLGGPGESANNGLVNSQHWQQAVKQNPILAGVVTGLQQTGHEITDPRTIAKNYSSNPVGAALNDIASVASVVPGVGEAVQAFGEGADAARVANTGATIAKYGNVLGHPLQAGRAGLAAMGLGAADSTLLHAASTGTEDALNAARSAQIARQAAERGTLRSGLATTGAKLDPTVQGVVGRAVDALDRVKAINNATTTEQVLGAVRSSVIGADGLQQLRGIIEKAGGETPENLAQVKNALRQVTLEESVNQIKRAPFVTAISDVDKASLSTAAQAAGTTVRNYIKKLGFTSLNDVLPQLVHEDSYYVPNAVASHLSSITDEAQSMGALRTTLAKSNRLAMTLKLGANPLTLLNRTGHLPFLLNSEHPLGALVDAVRTLRGNLTPEETDMLRDTRMTTHGAVWQATDQGLKSEVEDPARWQQIGKSLLDLPANVLQKSPILRAARSMDDAARTGFWLQARKAGATAEEADMLLGRGMGTFNRASVTEKSILTQVMPFYNWHKQVTLILEHMAEDHPAAFAQFTNAASHLVQNPQSANPGFPTIQVGGLNIDAGFLNPYSSMGADLNPGSLLSPVLRAGLAAAGDKTNLQPLIGATGPVNTAGRPFAGAAGQSIVNYLPALKAAQGVLNPYPRYATGQVNPNYGPMPWEQIWGNLLGLNITSVAQDQARAAASTKGQAAANKQLASSNKKYRAKLSKIGQ